MNVSGFSDDNDSTIAANRSDVNDTDPALSTLRCVITCAVLSLGIPGNILSAIVWLRHHVANKNSSAVYLAALAIVDLAFLVSVLSVYIFDCRDNYWLCHCQLYVVLSSADLEPLLVLGLSVERLIAILRPLQVRC